MFGTKFDKLRSAQRFCASLITLLCFIFCLPVMAAHQPQHHNTITLFTYADPPYVFEDNSKEKGLVELIVNELFKRADIAFQLRIVPKKRAIILAENKPGTCVFPVERNQEREVKFSWISPVLVSNTGLFQLRSKRIKQPLITLDDARSFMIGSQLGSATGEYLQSLGFQVDIAAKKQANIYKLKAGRIDLWAADNITANYLSELTSIEIGPSEIDFFTHLHALGCNLSIPTTTIEKLQTHLNDMYHDGTMDQLHKAFRQKKNSEKQP